MCEVADWTIMIFLTIAGGIDLKKQEIPLILLLKMGICIGLFRILIVDLSCKEMISGLLIGVAFLGVGKLTKEAIGYGDGWIILLLGFYKGGFVLLQIVLTASMAAAVVSGIYCIWNGWKKRHTIPFVPFLAVAYLGVVLL